MSDHFWRQLPPGLLKKTARGWIRLDPGVRKLVVELARAQNFKCAFCDETRDLIIEHDHYPEHGSGDKPTVYNIRGLACSGATGTSEFTKPTSEATTAASTTPTSASASTISILTLKPTTIAFSL